MFKLVWFVWEPSIFVGLERSCLYRKGQSWSSVEKHRGRIK